MKATLQGSRTHRAHKNEATLRREKVHDLVAAAVNRMGRSEEFRKHRFLFGSPGASITVPTIPDKDHGNYATVTLILKFKDKTAYDRATGEKVEQTLYRQELVSLGPKEMDAVLAGGADAKAELERLLRPAFERMQRVINHEPVDRDFNPRARRGAGF